MAPKPSAELLSKMNDQFWPDLKDFPDPDDPNFMSRSLELGGKIDALSADELNAFLWSVHFGSSVQYQSYKGGGGDPALFMAGIAADPKRGELDLTGLSAGHKWAVDYAQERIQQLAENANADTGHYDDGHGFGWKKPGAETPITDPTGHYDDGHAFGWDKPEADPMPTEEELEADLEKSKTIDGDRWVQALGVLASPPPKPTPKPKTLPIAVGVGAAVLLVVGAVAFAATRSTTVASDVARASTTPTTAPATSAPAGSRGTAAVLDPCTLITVAEASAILAATPQPTVTTRGTTPPGAQCEYDAKPAAAFAFQEPSRVARITINAVVITIASGPSAASSFSAKQAKFVASKDEQVSGLGDKAIYTGDAELSVLRGTSYVNVNTQSDMDWGDGNTRYEDVHQKYLALLVAFAKTALARMP